MEHGPQSAGVLDDVAWHLGVSTWHPTIFLEFAGDVIGVSGETKVIGENTDSKHQNMVPVSAFAFSVENKQSIGSATGGAGAGKAA